MSLEYREMIPTTVRASSRIQDPIVQIVPVKLAQLTGWRAFNSAREAGKIGFEDIVAILTQSESKGRTLFDLLLSSAIKAVKKRSDQSNPHRLLVICVVVAACCWPIRKVWYASTYVYVVYCGLAYRRSEKKVVWYSYVHLVSFTGLKSQIESYAS